MKTLHHKISTLSMFILVLLSASCLSAIETMKYFVFDDSFFGNSVTSAGPGWEGNAHRYYLDAGACSGLDRVHVVKGNGQWTSSFESFIVDSSPSGWISIMLEITLEKPGEFEVFGEMILNQSGTDVSSYSGYYRTFYHSGSNQKKLRWIKKNFQSWETWTIPDYHEAWWWEYDDMGVKVVTCTGWNNVSRQGGMKYARGVHEGTWGNFLADTRSGHPYTYFDVDVISLTQWFGDGPDQNGAWPSIEKFFYARVFMNGAWRSLGLVRWELWYDAKESDPPNAIAQYNYLSTVSTKTNMPCLTCP